MSMNSAYGDEFDVFPYVEDPVKLKKALKAWVKWYSAKLDRIDAQVTSGNRMEDYSGSEQDLFEALGCQVPDETGSD
jgi:hypothetical protein